MRALTPLEINRLKILTGNSVEVALIEPTGTGLAKSIMDATGPVRTFLKSHGIHDYDLQALGPSAKVMIGAFLVKPGFLVPSQASLYRPQTKQGDPRIWFKGLGEYAHANDILGIIAFGGKLYVVNITRLNIEDLVRDGYFFFSKGGELPLSTLGEPPGNPLKELLEEIKRASNQVAYELLTKIRRIAANGPVPAVIDADTAIGRTLEMLLGIHINSSKLPDYKGIEIKSYRDKGGNGKGGNRKTLFAQVPDWQLSKFKGSAEILQNFGYNRDGKTKLYCTVSTVCRNSQGLQLRLDNKQGAVVENAADPLVGDFAVWPLGVLHRRLAEKHNETFWVAAESTRVDGKEHFIFKKIEHTRKPILSRFDVLLEQGIITLDHLISKNSRGRVSEGGPLFKLEPGALGLLFPPSNTYKI